jgi:hypothetical protein
MTPNEPLALIGDEAYTASELARRDRMRNYQRASRERRQKRADDLWAASWASLHDVGCRYPEKRCRCKPVYLMIRP